MPCAEVGCAPSQDEAAMQIPQADERRKNLIGGEWRPPSTGQHEPCLNPADTREVLGLWPKSGAEDAKAAVDAAAKAFPDWAQTPGPERGRILRSEEHTSELQSRRDLVCRLLLEKKKR